MSERSHRLIQRMILASWVLIWFGTILAVNPRGSTSQAGIVSWGAGIMIQVAVVARWFLKRRLMRVSR